MKNLANCAPTEFMQQCVKLRGPFAAWLEKTGIAEIRARRPEGYDEMTDDQKIAAIREQGNENMTDILAAAMEKDFDGTVEVLALCCFTDPKEIDAHPMTEYLDAVLEMFNNDAVRGFFMYYLRPKKSTSSKA